MENMDKNTSVPLQAS